MRKNVLHLHSKRGIWHNVAIKDGFNRYFLHRKNSATKRALRDVTQMPPAAVFKECRGKNQDFQNYR